MGKMRQQNKELIAQQNKQGRAIVRETKHHDEQTDQSVVTLKIRHDEYNYVIANLSKAEERELSNKQKMAEMNEKMETLQEMAKVLNEQLPQKIAHTSPSKGKLMTLKDLEVERNAPVPKEEIEHVQK